MPYSCTSHLHASQVNMERPRHVAARRALAQAEPAEAYLGARALAAARAGLDRAAAGVWALARQMRRDHGGGVRGAAAQWDRHGRGDSNKGAKRRKRE
jgi:hypothetical protein